MHAFLTSALYGGYLSASRPGRFTRMERAPSTLWMWVWVGPQNQSEREHEEKIFQPLPGLEPPIIQHVAQHYTTELSPLCLTKHHAVKEYWGVEV
jgi:hypothetical protein